MYAFSPTGSQITGTADVVEVNGFIHGVKRDPNDNSISPEYARGSQEVCWGSQRSKRTHDPDQIQADLVAALKAAREIIDAYIDIEGPRFDVVEALNQVEGAIKLTETPGVEIYVDVDGDEWPVDELVLAPEDAGNAIEAGYTVELRGSGYVINGPDGDDLSGTYGSTDAAWQVAIELEAAENEVAA